MIATVTANPCMDKTVAIEKFDLYAMNRVRVLRTDPSGKGINVSRALHELGADTLCTGFDFFEDSSSPLCADLEGWGIPHDFLPVKGALRVCTKIFDESRKHTIEINERGCAVTDADGEALLQKAGDIAKRCDFLTLSGSLPAGLDADFYRRVTKQVRQCAPHCRVVVDAEGELLLRALDAAPFLIKPNIHEFESTFSCSVTDISQLNRAVQKLFARYNVEMICVSLGEKGAYIATREQAYCCPPVPVEIRSLQGAGDAMVAGICLALERGLPLCDVLTFGVAAAGAAISTEGTLPCRRADFERLRKEVAVQKL